MKFYSKTDDSARIKKKKISYIPLSLNYTQEKNPGISRDTMGK